MYAAAPYIPKFFEDTEPPSEDLRQEIQELSEKSNTDINEILIVDTKSSNKPDAEVSGILPGYKTLFISSDLINDFTEEEIKVLVTRELSGYLTRIAFVDIITTSVLFTVFLSELFTLSNLAFVLILVYFFVVRGYLKYRATYLSDRYAAEIWGRDKVIRTVEKQMEIKHSDEGRSTLFSLITGSPELKKRVGKLRN